ncbi:MULTISPECIES: DUF4232 domain-containing protein [unclassified Streptomyces]|uniref:DUF4232 domain-containing protein n=1 Tax=unclassified Streptomyces TaxID=2593676 RepID=UPI00224DF2D7|nr:MULTISPECIES: DUF4232 domain-containing protein [unclassified Streptomyces]MCX5293980.1 DUF4232 domain-containing protein [Streptomyces sp. NBC_00183]
MRATPITVAALAAALLLTACDDNGGDGAASGDTNKSGTSESKAGDACTLDGVGVQVAASAAPGAGDSGNVTVTITNRGSKCTLNGFPGVGLHAGADSSTVPADKAAKAQKLTLAKDATASFTIAYVRGEAGGSKSLAVKTAAFTLPGSSAAHSFKWSYGDVALKSGASSPNASVTAFQQAGD